MKAGKSTLLLQASHNYGERGMQTMLFTAKLDNRSSLGKITSRIASGFGMKIIGYDPIVRKVKNVKNVDFQDIFRFSDIITIHIHLNQLTENLVDREQFNLMKKNSILINTSRGKLVNQDALIDALKNKQIGGACLDVIDGEWNTKKQLLSHPLIKYSKKNNNLIITPHIGGSTEESISLARIFMIKK